MKPWLIRLVAGVILLALVLVVRGPATHLLQQALLPLISHFSYWAERINEGGRAIAVPDEASLQACESRLQNRIVDSARLSALEQENQLLRAQASFLNEAGYDHVGAEVIARRIEPIHARLLINRGTNDAIETGDVVVAERGLVIGRIVEAQSRLSTVELLTDIDSRLAIASAKDGQLIGVLEGRGNGATVLTYIPSSVDVAADDLLLTAGTEEKIPPRLAVGVINTITRNSKDPFYEASVDSVVRIERLSFVSVLRPKAYSH